MKKFSWFKFESRPVEKTEELVRRENLIWLLIAQAAAIIPLLFYLPVWLGVFWLGGLVWRVQIYRGRLAFPGFFAKAGIGVLGMGVIYASFQGVKGVEPMVSLLVFSFAFKTIEIRSQKDALILVYIGFIVIAAQFLFAQDIVSAVIGIISCIVMITAWETIFHRRNYSTRYKLKRGAWLLVHSMPLMLVFFVVAPRLGPLWSVPIPGQSAKTGFSDSLGIGDIGKLVKSSETAFRVTMLDDELELERKDMYWRGLVLDRYDGTRWRRWPKTRKKESGNSAILNQEGQLLKYEVLLEPHQQPWLFALMAPSVVEYPAGKARITTDYLVESIGEVFNKVQYTVISSTNNGFVAQPELSDTERRFSILLPTTTNPRAQKLGEEWRNSGLSTVQIVERALNLYSNSFHYTLSPPTLGANSIDEFLFITRRGFCEHFASSFVFLMRSAGVPSRIVVGYHGGEQSNVENYLRVTQADAHAWAEIWLEGRGWLRVDPTAAVAPSRVELGLSEALDENERGAVGGALWRSSLWVMRLQHQWDALGYVWTRFVLNYDNDTQQGILRRLLGGVDPWRIGIGMLVCCVVILGLYFILSWFFNRRIEIVSEEVKLYRRYCKKLARFQIFREPQDTPRDLSERVKNTLPNAAGAAKNIEQLFLRITYDEQPDLLPVLKKAIRFFPQELKP